MLLDGAMAFLDALRRALARVRLYVSVAFLNLLGRASAGIFFLFWIFTSTFIGIRHGFTSFHHLCYLVLAKLLMDYNEFFCFVKAIWHWIEGAHLVV
jgi:hypothetical protein